MAIAVVGGPEGEAPTAWCTPCGVCRQVIREWCDPATFRIVLGKADAAPREYLLQDILPMGFGPEDLGGSSPAGASGDDAVKGADGGHEHGCGCGCSEHGGRQPVSCGIKQLALSGADNLVGYMKLRAGRVSRYRLFY